MRKSLYVFAGANGSGKTSLYKRHQSLFDEIPFINADEMLLAVTSSNDPTNAKFGQQQAIRKIEEFFSKEQPFCFETDFSHESKIELAKLLGYMISIYLFENDYSQGHRLVAHKKPLGEVVVGADAPGWVKQIVDIGYTILPKNANVSLLRLKKVIPGKGAPKKLTYKQCLRCNRRLRGEKRRNYGICSVCEPRIKL